MAHLSLPLIRKHTLPCVCGVKGQVGGADTMSAAEQCNCVSVNCGRNGLSLSNLRSRKNAQCAGSWDEKTRSVSFFEKHEMSWTFSVKFSGSNFFACLL